jgi:hypothetical protein
MINGELLTGDENRKTGVSIAQTRSECNARGDGAKLLLCQTRPLWYHFSNLMATDETGNFHQEEMDAQPKASGRA